MSEFTIDPDTEERLDLIATATVSDGGWVDLAGPITVRAGGAFVALTKRATRESSDRHRLDDGPPRIPDRAGR